MISRNSRNFFDATPPQGLLFACDKVCRILIAFAWLHLGSGSCPFLPAPVTVVRAHELVGSVQEQILSSCTTSLVSSNLGRKLIQG